VSFAAQHPAAVTAVQQTLGQLDLMLAGQGLSLGQAHVGQQGSGQRGDTPRSRNGGGETELALDALAPASAHASAVGLLDTFA
jgi:flagellar hook-length control protein FliK